MEREHGKSTATDVGEASPDAAPDGRISPEDASFERRNGQTAIPLDPAMGSEPGHVGFSDVFRVYWLTALLPLVLCLGVAAAVGLLRAPTYTAEARLSVDVPTFNPEAIPGSVTASQALASTYSRAITSTVVLRAASKDAGLTRAETVSRLSATPIPQSPLVRVVGEGPNEKQAVALANAGADALVRNAVTTNDSTTRSDKLFADFEAAVRKYEDRLAVEKSAKREADQSQTAESERALAEAQVATQAALLERETLREQYQLSRQVPEASLEPLVRAESAASDRSSIMQILLFAGAITGLALGAGLAALRAYRIG